MRKSSQKSQADLRQAACFVRSAFASNLGGLCIGQFRILADTKKEFKYPPIVSRPKRTLDTQSECAAW